MLIKQPSIYQENIFNTFLNTNNNIVCKAVPGSGKTTTLLHLLELVDNKKDSLFAAFNKSIVNELIDKVPVGVKVSTVHSLGASAIYSHYKTVKFNENKIIGIVYKLKKNWEKVPKKSGTYFYTICELVNLCRLSLCANEQELEDLSNKFGILTLLDEVERAYEIIKYLKADYFKASIVIDYADMIYIPVMQKLALKTYENVFIDEGQDLSKCQQEFLKKLIKKAGRFVMVGDPNQSIYSFLGADEFSFDNFCQEPHTDLLPLSISYRCSKSVVKEANALYEGIESFEKAVDGEIRYGELSEVKSGDFVLCRNNLPLFHAFLYFLSNEKKCYIKGKDFERKLMLLLGKLDQFNAEASMEELLNGVYEKLKNKGVKKPLLNPKVIELQENFNIIKVLLKNFGTIENVKIILKDIFNDDKEDPIVLSTIHKSKGLETKNVFILMHELIPSKYAKLGWELEAEKKLLFVAYTRSKENIIFLKEKF